MIRHSLIGISLRLRIADLPPCGRRERETIGGKLPTVLYVRVSSSYHGKVVLKITAVLLKNSTALLIKQACLYEKQSKFSIPIRTLCGLCVLQSLWAFYLGILAETPNPFPVVKGCVCLVGFASLQSPWAHTLKASLPCLPLPLHRTSQSPQSLQKNNNPFASHHHPCPMNALLVSQYLCHALSPLPPLEKGEVARL